MTHDRAAALFFELFDPELPRHGPGDVASTLNALALVPALGADARVLDVGCGSGAQSLVLARHTPARIISVDSHAPFVEMLSQRIRRLDLGGRVEARVGDMRRLEFPPHSFDLIWCEGAIFIIGFEAGLREWRRLLAPGGHLAVTEACWTKPDVPAECAAFWAREYPAIRPVAALLDAIDACGYETVGHFTLPASSWWDEYYAPLQQKLHAFRERHREEADAQALADHIQYEIDAWQAWSDYYSYEFFVIRAR
jgi:SAM-dependent methyltransferase